MAEHGRSALFLLIVMKIMRGSVEDGLKGVIGLQKAMTKYISSMSMPHFLDESVECNSSARQRSPP